MLSKNFLSFLLAVKIVASQTVYPTTQVSYSTNAVPTVQTFPVSATVTAVPSAVTATAMPATAAITAMPTAVTATAMPATATITTTVMPSSLMSPTVTLAPTPVSINAATVVSYPVPTSAPKVTVSPVPSSANPTEPKAYFLPANIPNPKVTVLSNDLPTIIEIIPKRDDCIETKTTSPDRYTTPIISRKDSGPMTAVKRVTMACTDDIIIPNEESICPEIPKMDVTPTPVLKKDIKSNPIDFEGLFDSFMTCL